MTPDDLIALVLSTLGMTREQLLTALLTVVAFAPVVSWLRPRVDPVLCRWRDRALLTRTTADDNAVKAATLVWSGVVWCVSKAIAWAPIFATQDEVDELTYQRRTARILEKRK